jgi:hypothetical protein
MSRARQIVWAILIAGAAVFCLVAVQHRFASNSVATDEPPNAQQAESRPQKLAPLHGPPNSSLTVEAKEAVSPNAIAAAPPMAPMAPGAAAPVADTPESSTLPAMTILQNMRTAVLQYASTFGENPVGTNPEITGALEGDNPKHIDFLKQDGNRVNAVGELVDPWGTPYFFHQISSHEMEIRSAGPDRVMYTGDDLVTR